MSTAIDHRYPIGEYETKSFSEQQREGMVDGYPLSAATPGICYSES